ncbi:MAG: hypothetical protein GF317_04130 [Candidatus Lokiarchaeota archaeon]|nr:hypothetical protein [Candidatus Lokiarchaeota archaeon]MBD3199075.1 hypothetical protein [Candidatus Lokiarchaeota archaeon]
MILQFDLTRFIQVYVIQGLVMALCFFLAIRTIQRNKKRLNLIFSGFYFSVGIGLFLNFIYAPLQIEGLESVVLILNFLTNYFIALGPIFFVIFELILIKSEKIIDRNKQIMLISIYALILLFMLVFLPFGGVVIDSTTDWKPTYNFVFYLYLMITLFIGTSLPSLYYAFSIYNSFGDPSLKKRWRFFIIGIMVLFIFMYGTFTANYLNNQTFRTIWSLIGLVGVISGTILVYFGVGRQIEQK